KRGRGGIRDVEFAVQLLQLVHARRHPALREPGTLPALRALADEGFVAPADAEALADSYRFLRRLEHRLQMVRDLQTHELPRGRAALETLARSMGLDGPDRLMAEHERHTARVRGLHEQLFYRPLLEAFGAASAGAPRPGIDRQDTEELLAGLGFADPAAAYRAFARIVDPATRAGKVLGGLFPVMAPALATAALPDAALVRFERVVAALRESADEGLADRLAGRVDAARRLAALVGVSSHFADALAARPGLAGDAAERVMARARDAGWQVDPDLRPEGRSGPAARSLASYLEYWQRWADTWEYQALLGARFVAGDEVLGRRFVANAHDVAYPETVTLEQVAAIRRMRVRMEEERVWTADA